MKALIRHLHPAIMAGVCLFVTGAAAKPLTLDDAIVGALRTSPLIRAARYSTKAMEAQLLKARSAAWPRADLSALIAPMPAQRGNAVKGSTDLNDWGYFVYTNIEGVVPIYSFGKISALKTAARYGVSVGRYREKIARMEVVFQVQSVYYAAVGANAILEALQDGKKYVDRAGKKLHELEKEDDPDFDPVDKMKFRVFRSKYFSQRARAASIVDQARDALGVLIASRTVDLPSDLAPIAWIPKKQDYYMRQALAYRPELLAMDAAVKAREAQVSFRKSAFYPDLFIAGRFTIGHSNVADPQGSPFSNDPYNTYNAAGTLGLKMDLDIGGKIADLDMARAELSELLAKREAARQGVRIEVMKTLRGLREAREQLKYAKDAVKAAKSWSIAESDLYDNGFCSIKDLTDAVVQYYKSKSNYYSAVAGFNIRLMKLKMVIGQSWRGKK